MRLCVCVCVCECQSNVCVCVVPGGSPFSWWSRGTSSGKDQTHWAGPSPGTQHWAEVSLGTQHWAEVSPGTQHWAEVSPGTQHWARASPGIQLCACGLQHNCLDTQHHCNCDSKWYRNILSLFNIGHVPNGRLMPCYVARQYSLEAAVF